MTFTITAKNTFDVALFVELGLTVVGRKEPVWQVRRAEPGQLVEKARENWNKVKRRRARR